jgi:hypothetical protein
LSFTRLRKRRNPMPKRRNPKGTPRIGYHRYDRLGRSRTGIHFAAALLCAAPQVWAQVFVGTPVPQQFSGQGQPSTRNGEWPSNGAELSFSGYSPLDQINASNFDKLELAWRFKTDHFGSHPEYKLEGTPYLLGAGEQRWRHVEAKRVSGPEIDDRLEFGRYLHWKVGRPLPWRRL